MSLKLPHVAPALDDSSEFSVAALNHVTSGLWTPVLAGLAVGAVVALVIYGVVRRKSRQTGAAKRSAGVRWPAVRGLTRIARRSGRG